MELSKQQQTEFLDTLWDFYAKSARHELPWRQPEHDGSFDPYKIMVSELMLQQTQVSRVIPKYHAFLEQFPTVDTLASAELGDVLRAWQGLGYNRRAKFLWQAARAVHELGSFPGTREELIKLPGIGTNTAGAILAYAFNEPVVFVETNVRTVFIHHFFADKNDVHDKDILNLVEQTLDHEHPREFYWALMDYGSHLKTTIGNLNKVSRHYTKQSKFHGSKRQIRGAVLRALGTNAQTLAELREIIDDERLEEVLGDLKKEGLIRETQGAYCL
jgi:A/G-specific adenine glycosylase